LLRLLIKPRTDESKDHWHGLVESRKTGTIRENNQQVWVKTTKLFDELISINTTKKNNKYHTMTKPKYLYGAAVQGIQGFIFQTNALKEIAGASELVEQICTVQFAKAANIKDLINDPNAIVTAAGNIKYVFGSEDVCREVVLSFPKQIMELAPGITISQAVVRIDDGEISKEHIDELERKLRTQRNKPFIPFVVGLMSVNRTRTTGLPSVEFKNKEYNDLGVVRKRKAIEAEGYEIPKYGRLVTDFFGTSNVQIALDMKYITKSKSDNYSWLAVIHADGNNMGIALQKLADKTKEINGIQFINIFRSFSKALDLSTKEAAKKAYLEVMKTNPINSNDKLPFRPIVIGGDDLTIICRADLALDFTQHFLKHFENESKANFNNLAVKIDFLKEGLSACAGIAFIKENYPFHYGYHLAEKLCDEAKKAAKEGLINDALTPSCLMFHKVQASFVEDYKEIKNKELKAGDLRFDFGPYYLDKKEKPTIDKLQSCVSQFEGKEGNAIKSNLRQWLTDLHDNKELAQQKMKRIISVANGESLILLKKLGLPENATKDDKSPIYDWLTINSINQGGK